MKRRMTRFAVSIIGCTFAVTFIREQGFSWYYALMILFLMYIACDAAISETKNDYLIMWQKGDGNNHSTLAGSPDMAKTKIESLKGNPDIYVIELYERRLISTYVKEEDK